MLMTKFFLFIFDLPVQRDRAARAPIAHELKRWFEDVCLPMAESLPWSPHWEFGISHWQLETMLHYLSGKRKTCAARLAATRRTPSRLAQASQTTSLTRWQSVTEPSAHALRR
jgi:hypothetical protein